VPIEKITGEVFELDDQVAMLVDAIRNGRPLTCNANDGRWAVAMCLAAQCSIEARKSVTLADVNFDRCE
jgi:myo-inositol 2-dehydrogenase/D-chiro-inositol 1-dehydrogenase